MPNTPQVWIRSFTCTSLYMTYVELVNLYKTYVELVNLYMTYVELVRVYMTLYVEQGTNIFLENVYHQAVCEQCKYIYYFY